MKRKITIIVSALLGLMVIGYCVFVHFNPYINLQVISAVEVKENGVDTEGLVFIISN